MDEDIYDNAEDVEVGYTYPSDPYYADLIRRFGKSSADSQVANINRRAREALGKGRFHGEVPLVIALHEIRARKAFPIPGYVWKAINRRASTASRKKFLKRAFAKAFREGYFRPGLDAPATAPSMAGYLRNALKIALRMEAPANFWHDLGAGIGKVFKNPIFSTVLGAVAACVPGIGPALSPMLVAGTRALGSVAEAAANGSLSAGTVISGLADVASAGSGVLPPVVTDILTKAKDAYGSIGPTIHKAQQSLATVRAMATDPKVLKPMILTRQLLVAAKYGDKKAIAALTKIKSLAEAGDKAGLKALAHVAAIADGMARGQIDKGSAQEARDIAAGRVGTIVSPKTARKLRHLKLARSPLIAQAQATASAMAKSAAPLALADAGPVTHLGMQIAAMFSGGSATVGAVSTTRAGKKLKRIHFGKVAKKAKRIHFHQAAKAKAKAKTAMRFALAKGQPALAARIAATAAKTVNAHLAAAKGGGGGPSASTPEEDFEQMDEADQDLAASEPLENSEPDWWNADAAQDRDVSDHLSDDDYTEQEDYVETQHASSDEGGGDVDEDADGFEDAEDEDEEDAA